MSKQNPKDQAGCLSLLFFSWMYGLIRLAYRRPLSEDDLYELSESDKAEDIVEHFEELWGEEVTEAKEKGRNPRLWKTILRFIPLKDYLSFFSLCMLEWFVSWSSIIFLWIYQKMSLEDPQKSMSNFHVAAMIGICSCCLIAPFAANHNALNAFLVGMRLKVACMGAIYKKVLASSRSNLSRTTGGTTINLISNDAQRIEKLINYFKMSFLFYFDLPVAIALLTILVEWQSLAGLFVIFIISLVNNSFSTKHFGNLRVKQAGIADKRLAILNDIVKGIRTVKIYALEWKNRKRIKELRGKEIGTLRLKSLILAINDILLLSLFIIATLVSIVTMIYSGVHVNPVNIFTVTLVLSNINRSTTLLASGNTGLSDGLASIMRMQKYLSGQWESDHQKHKEVSQDLHVSFEKKKPEAEKGKLTEIIVNPRYKSRDNHSTATVRLCAVSSGWIDNSNQCALNDISLSVPPSQLLMVIGPVGSGKSTLLMTILDQISIKSGNVFTEGRIAYASQTPWIFTGTIRDNILFGKAYQEKRYERVLEVCDLSQDILRFPRGDLSMIGQSGVSLSGGQRARVGLARAVYSDADIFLLDDPLSAVDAKVGKHIFDKCICEELSGKTRILVTHQLQHLHRADEIVALKEGRIVDHGSYEHISEDISIREMLEDYKTADLSDVSDAGKPLPFQDEVTGRDMIEEEEDNGAEPGAVSWRLYSEYFRVGLPVPLLVGLLVFFIASQGVVVAAFWWQKIIAIMPYSQQRSPKTLGVYAAIAGGACIIVSIRVILIFFAFIRSSEKVHDKMTAAVLKSPVLFFDTNPVGRIMNRFSKDMGALDDLLPVAFTISISCFMYFVGVFLLTAIANIWFFMAIIPILIFLAIVGSMYLRIVRQLSRIEAIRCSPIYEHVEETIAGLEVIHTSNMDGVCLDKYYRYHDLRTRSFSLLVSTRQVMALYVDVIFALFVTGIGMGCLLLSLDLATTGLILSYAMTLKTASSTALTFACEAETQMASVERVIAYTKLPPEQGYDRQAKIPTNWPNRGALSLRGVSLSYFEGGSSILKDINLDVQPREKVGIAGRTGAGKSSLVAALFRMPDPQGQVIIDGIDLGAINLQDARSSMAVITQSPVLFEGSLKTNLDPFDQFTEDEIWTALKEVQLLNCVSKLEGMLRYALGEEGSGFSVGERQLLCLARALLQQRKILILDEATANVDYRTDDLIQQVIREKFSDCTVLTIAHRLNTIIDYDRVVVLDGGRIVEDDSPRVLASKSDGIFARLLQDNGHESP